MKLMLIVMFSILLDETSDVAPDIIINNWHTAFF